MTTICTRTQLEDYLEKEGFNVDFLGGQCPFQIEADHKSGISIYLRARYSKVVLAVYDEHYTYGSGLPDDDCLLWSDSFQCWDEYGASYIDYPEAFYVFYSLWSDAKDWID